MVAVTLALRDLRIAWALVAGIGAGLLALCTPQFLPWAPIAAAVIVLARHGSRRTLVTAGAMLLASAAVVAPWTIRNYRVFDRFIPVSTGDFGYSLFIGTFESNTNWTDWNEFPEEIFASPDQKRAVLAERDRFLAATTVGSIRATESDRFFRALALERLAADPLGMLVLGLERLPRLWFQLSIPMYEDSEASGWWFVFYFVFAMWALVAANTDTRRLMLPIAALFVYQNAIYLPLHVEPRQAVPVMPSLLSLTAIGLDLVRARRHHREGAART
jgi:4-amino-4-deoxy-L-arabinose transferase-like glycosyltransferase